MLKVNSQKSKVIVILGPTASGKSSLAVKLAEKIHGEIVNADSRQVYKKMDIGTGKTDSLGSKIPHHLLDIVFPDKPFSLAQYQRLAFRAIDDILRRNKIPILVGGTGLYIRAVVDNLDIPKVKPNITLRQKLEKQTAAKLFSQLKKLDPKTAEIIDYHNKRRLLRALEVVLIKHTSFAELQKTKKPRYDILQIGLKTDRAILRQRIEKRFIQMIKNGLLEETKKLLKKYPANLPSMSGIGYLEIGQYLAGEISLQEAVNRAVSRTYQYAKRQTTWFKKDERIKWISKTSQAGKYILNFLKK
ncbi:tRNA (adenosine(37)-N6)-dimethylallyltransferase MiaA [Patescibacteria group bacterium]|nr:MAG: tRNA (adenosine(37)-N6)-dimethylallyltransferase MiaA [Patescibacteria group bacterium]